MPEPSVLKPHIASEIRDIPVSNNFSLPYLSGFIPCSSQFHFPSSPNFVQFLFSTGVGHNHLPVSSLTFVVSSVSPCSIQISFKFHFSLFQFHPKYLSFLVPCSLSFPVPFRPSLLKLFSSSVLNIFPVMSQVPSSDTFNR